jgi:hypothetical protein
VANADSNRHITEGVVTNAALSGGLMVLLRKEKEKEKEKKIKW